MRARLLESRVIGPEVRHFVFEVPAEKQLEYTPGQFVSFKGLVTGREITRAYSLASPPSGNRFELCLNRIREGMFSPYLFDLQPGNEVEMHPPMGYFVPRSPFRDAVFVATGTGIAPFRGMLRWPPVLDGTARVTLLFGARHPEGLVYRDEFEHLAAARPGFAFLPTVTRPDSAWTGRTGRVQQHLDEALDGRRDIDVYICGLKAMVDDVRQILKKLGFDRKQIVAEKYD